MKVARNIGVIKAKKTPQSHAVSTLAVGKLWFSSSIFNDVIRKWQHAGYSFQHVPAYLYTKANHRRLSQIVTKKVKPQPRTEK